MRGGISVYVSTRVSECMCYLSYVHWCLLAVYIGSKSMMEMKPSYGPLVFLLFSACIGILDCLFFFPVKWFLEWYLSNFYRFCFSFLSNFCGSSEEAFLTSSIPRSINSIRSRNRNHCNYFILFCNTVFLKLKVLQPKELSWMSSKLDT